MTSLREYFGKTSAAFRAVGLLFKLIGQSREPVVFLRQAREGDLEGAFETIPRPNEELHKEVTAMRTLSLSFGEDMPEPSEDEMETISH
jgi:hypothetical protein